MSKILENKEIIHIVSEIIVLVGLTIYFSQKNKKIMEYIEDLSQKINDQEEIINKNIKLTNKLSNDLQEMQQYVLQLQTQQTQEKQNLKTKQSTSINVPQNVNKSNGNIKKIPIILSTISSFKNKDTKKDKNKVVEVEEEDFKEDNFKEEDVNESDLDTEISEELRDLVE